MRSPIPSLIAGVLLCFFLPGVSYAQCSSGYVKVLESEVESMRSDCEATSQFKGAGTLQSNVLPTTACTNCTPVQWACVLCSCTVVSASASGTGGLPHAGSHQECMNMGASAAPSQNCGGGNGLLANPSANCTVSTAPTSLPSPAPAPAPAKAATAGVAPATGASNDTPAPSPAPASTTKQPATATVGTPTGDTSTDTATCKTAASNAVNCCNNPMNCIDNAVTKGYVNSSDANNVQGFNEGSTRSPSYTGNATQDQRASMAAACDSMRQNTASTAPVNSGLGSYCYDLKTTCKTTCQAMKDSHTGSTDYDSYLDQCNNLSYNSSAMGNSAYSNQTSAGMSASQCQNMSGMMPQSLADNSQPPTPPPPMPTPAPSSFNPGDPYGCQSNPSSQACQSCQANPGGAACKALSAQPNIGQAAFAKNEATGRQPSDFNVGNPMDSTSPVDPMFGAGGQSKPSKVPTIPNNGGGMANSGSSGGRPADAPASGMRPQAGGSGFANIDQGFRSGGGYAYPIGPNKVESNAPGRTGRGPASARGKEMDLKQYLPGGDLDPRHGAGLMGKNGEIGSRFGDIWKNITDRMHEKCNLGELLDCK